MIKCINCFKNCLFPVIYNRCISLLLGLRKTSKAYFFYSKFNFILTDESNWYEIDQIAQLLIITKTIYSSKI